MTKTQLAVTVQRTANNGKGVGTAPDGRAVFVSGGIPGDRLLTEVTAERSRFYEARILKILSSSPNRIPPDCPDHEICGGCCFRHMTYECELEAKTGFVRDAFIRIGGFDISCEPILPSPLTDAYRNKAEFAVGTGPNGDLFAGFYSEKTHQAVPVPDCRIIPEDFLKISKYFFKIVDRVSGCAWDPKTRKGIFRHLVLRKSGLTGEIMLIISSAANSFPGETQAAERIRAEFPQVTSVILNVNRASGGTVLGPHNRILSGESFIRDQICGVPVEIGPLSFFQVNTPAAESLYRTAAEFAEIRPEDTVLDLYCGMGTIGLAAAAGCRQLIGGEIIPEAVESAKRSAARMGLANTRFLCGDAGMIAGQLIREGIRPDVIILDPPRKGCSPETLQAVKTLAPERIVMVSCDPATAARDCRVLCNHGYTLTRIRPADLFPRTKHVETCVLLTHPFMSKS